MPIDFEDEQSEPAVALQTCAAHNLKYDPSVTWGCVLCRRAAKKRISWYVVVGGAAIAVALAFLLVPMIPTGEGAGAMPAVRSDATGSPADRTALCDPDRFAAVERCVARLGAEADRIDKELCLQPVAQVGCTGLLAGAQADSPVYFAGDAPRWPQLREAVLTAFDALRGCVGGTDYRFAVRLAVDGQAHLQDIVVSPFGLTPSQRYCVYDAFSHIAWPQAAGPYTVIDVVDGGVLAALAPDKQESRDKEFRRFVEESRRREERDRLRRDAMRARDAINKTYQQELQRK